MAENAYVNLGATPPSWSALRDVIVGQSGLTFTAASAVPNTNCVPALEIRVAGVTYFYDSADTTSAHDGAAIMVSADGRRYKLGYPQFVPNRVETFGNTPAASPALGNAFLIGAAPSGAWAAHANKVAVWTVNGWAFIAPANMAGRFVYVAAEDATYQYTATGWRKGLGSGGLSDHVVWPDNLAAGFGRNWIVENQTTNAPPSAPAEGTAYIVGPSPTGGWAGQQTRVAHYLGGAWRFFAPAEGFIAWDRATDQLLIWRDGAWRNPVIDQTTIPRLASQYASVSTTLAVSGGGNSASFVYAYSDATAPTTSMRRIVLAPISINYASTASGKKIRFTFDGIALPPGSEGFVPTIAIWRDLEANAVFWAPMNRDLKHGFVISGDAAAHTFSIAVTSDAAIGIPYGLQKNASFSAEEVP